MKRKRIYLFLVGMAIIISIFFLFSNSEIKNQSPADFERTINSEEVFLINAHAPYIGEIERTDLIAENWQNISFYKNKLPKDKNTPIAVYCRSGSMSSNAAKQLLELGYNEIYNLEGGMNSWESSGRKILIKNEK